MRYTQLTDAQVDEALAVIGVDSVDALFTTIPESVRCKKPLTIPDGKSELEMLADAGELAARNNSCAELTCFLGGGSYDHFIPTIVDEMASQSEFLTAYTPYQAEASQGILQLFYEFQTMVCELAGMEVANASLYEFASAAAEAMMMSIAITRREKVILAGALHPDTTATLQTYANTQSIDVEHVPAGKNGQVDADALESKLDDTVAAVILQTPNYLGCLEPQDALIPRIQKAGALAVVSFDPLSAGLCKSPGACGADIVVGDGQALGIPMQYGGPGLGLMATRETFLRKMPGRVVGATRDTEDRRGFCLVLQTREQHIRRDRATSNICTNQGLLAIRASVYLAAAGREGIKNVARQCFDKAHYAADRIARLDGYQVRFDAPFFKEFTVQTDRDVNRVLETCRDQGLLAGIPLFEFDPQLANCFLVAVTEKRTRQEIDRLVQVLEGV